MLQSYGHFMRSPTTMALLGAMPYDPSSSPPSLTDREAKALSLEPCVGGFRVLTRDADGNATAAEACDATTGQGKGSSSISKDQLAAIGKATGDAIGKAIHDLTTPKGSAAPPPDASLIPGIPNVALAVAAVAVVAFLAFKLA